MSNVANLKNIKSATERLKNLVNSEQQRNYIVTLFFLMCLSNRWEKRYETLKNSLDNEELIDDLMRNERFQAPEISRFSYLYERRNDSGNGKRMDQALLALEQANINKLTNLFQNVKFDSNELGDETQKNMILAQLLEDFNKIDIDYTSNESSSINIDGMFESVIEWLSSNLDKSDKQFYTPKAVSKLIVELIDPQPTNSICDPFCGSASLLTESANYLIRQFGLSTQYALYGQEISHPTWALGKMNLFLHNQENHQLFWGDTIRSPKLRSDHSTLQKFDVVVSQPPFSSQNWGHEVAEGDIYGRFNKDELPPKSKGDYAYILHMLSSIDKDKGKMAVVVPLGALFRGANEAVIRQKLVDENKLDAVITLPEKLHSHTNIACAILIFKSNKEDSNVLFIDASDGYQAVSRNQNTITERTSNKILQAYKTRQSMDNFAYLASLDEIKKKKYNCSISLYVSSFVENNEINLKAITDEKKQLKEELVQLDEKISQLTKDLG